MLRNLLLYSFLIVMPTLALGQPAPDFTITDTDGTEWNLHEQLSLGRTVVLDFFFVDCVPCQTQSPEVSTMYQDYQAANLDVLVLGISNRDADLEVEQFDQTYGISYPTAGEEGGGDTITDIYQSWYPFFGWPWYAVVCPDTSLEWLASPPTVPGVPELRALVDQCLGTSSVQEQVDPTGYFIFDGNRLTVKSTEIRSISITDMLGRSILNFDNVERGMSFQIPTNAVFVLSLSLKDQQPIHLKIKL